MLDTLEIVVAPIMLPIGTCPLAEIVVNGVPLTEMVERIEPDGTGYAPLLPKDVLGRLHDALATGLRPTRVHVLGCCCGDDWCSHAHVVVRSRPEAVRWDGITTSSSGDQALPLGPFIFDRGQYETALESPRMADAPVRPYSC